jgi:hypothetical protein
MSKKGMKYDYKKAYDKNLPMSERFHYLENARHDKDSDSPATFMGAITAATIGRKASAGGNFDRAKYERLSQMGGLFGKLGQQVLDQNPVADPISISGAAPVAPVVPTADMSAGAVMSGGAMNPTNPFAGKTFKIEPASPMGMVDPELSSVGIDASQTFQPPMAGNEMGGAKDLFGDKTRGMAETIYGSAMQRQASVKTPLGMSPLQGNAFIKAKIDAEKSGASTFEVDGKTYNVK